MKLFKIVAIIPLLVLTSCQSKVSQYYVLNPLPYTKVVSHQYSYLRLGINEVECPPSVCKPDIVVSQSPHRVALTSFHQWAGALHTNIKNIVEANLTLLLPGSAVVNFPWPAGFKPNYQLQLDILQLEINTRGCSRLRVNYFIYRDLKLVRKGSLYYLLKVTPVKVESLVASMNKNLTHLTQDLAKVIANLPQPVTPPSKTGSATR